MTQPLIAAFREADPRYNAGPRLSDLQGDARRAALIDRHHAHTDSFMARYQGLAAASGEPVWHSLAAGAAVAVAIGAIILLFGVFA